MTQLPLTEAIPRFKANEERIDVFVNGLDTSTYLTSDGDPVPSILKFLKDKDDEINVATGGILSQVTAARDITITKRDEAITARDLAIAWAQGTLPGGADTKSAKEWSEAAQAAVAMAQISVGSLAALKAIDTTTTALAYLNLGARSGLFAWRTGDYSAKVAADTLGGVYLKADAVAAATGAWVRVRESEAVWDPMWFGAKADQATNDLPVFQCIHALAAFRDMVLMPSGFCALTGTWAVTKALSLVGKSKYNSGFFGVGFSQDVSLVDYQGDTGNRLQNIRMENIAFRSDNALARGLTLTWVNLSSFRNVYFYNLYSGCVENFSWSNSWENVSSFAITNSSLVMQDECNNQDFRRCAFVGHRGIHIIGSLAGLTLVNCDFEGINKNGATPGAGLRIAPPTGKTVRAVNVVGGYWEAIDGYAIEASPTDAFAVRALSIRAAYFYGKHVDADVAIVLSNVNGFVIEGNQFEDWDVAAIAYQATAINGRVANNVCDTATVPALTNNSNLMHASVEVINNSYGRKVEYSSAVPTTGSYTRGDIVNNTQPSLDANNLILMGWIRLTTGSAHVIGTDWGRMYNKHTSP